MPSSLLFAVIQMDSIYIFIIFHESCLNDYCFVCKLPFKHWAILPDSEFKNLNILLSLLFSSLRNQLFQGAKFVYCPLKTTLIKLISELQRNIYSTKMGAASSAYAC
uniref:Uncharacterized protein n=2 Tax=Micrurus TaxID=8634 RepID=A0A2D4I7W4_MICLE